MKEGLMEQSEIDRLVKVIKTRLKDDDHYGRSRIYEAQGALAAEFGRRRGWLLVPREFGIRAVAAGRVQEPDQVYSPSWEEWTCVDHSYCYRDAPKRAAALVVHLYDLDKDEVRKFAAQHGVIAEFPGAFPSWWYPGWTRLVVYRPV